jgi:hypothetical protein
MKATKKLLATALAASAILVVADVQAQSGAKHGSGAHRGGGQHQGGYRHGGHHWRGHHHFWGPSWGWHFGVPLFWGAAWGWPYYYDYYDFPRDRVIYREVEAFPEGTILPGPSTEVPRGEGAPTRGPLYMNYCESAKAYFPKVTKCPEGWRLATPSS